MYRSRNLSIPILHSQAEAQLKSAYVALWAMNIFKTYIIFPRDEWSKA